MRPRNIQRRLGLTLVSTALVGAALAGAPAMAQDATEVDVPVTATALVTYPANDVIPNTLLGQFPPQIVCVLFPQACPEELEPIRDPIAGVLRAVDANQETLPLQLANPDGLTVTYLAGTPRYASAVQLELPEVPAGEEVDEFVVTFPQGQPSFSFDSPLFRQAIMAVIQTVDSQDPAVLLEQLAKTLQAQPLSQPVLGIEACPLTVPVPEDAAAPRSVPVRDVSEENVNGDLEPAVDCLYGSNGQFDPDASTWSFDLSSAARAWADGTLDNNGVLLRPTGAPNLAFGDPDISTNAQVVLDVSEPPRATFASSEPPPPVEPLGAMPPASSSSGGDTTGASPSMVSQPPSSQVMSSPVSEGTSTQTTPPAEVAPPQTAPEAGGDQSVALDATPAGQQGPSTPWAVWLLVVPFAGGAWLTARSLSEQVAATGGSGGGALTRLVEGGLAG